MFKPPLHLSKERMICNQDIGCITAGRLQPYPIRNEKPKHSMQSVARYASACGPTNPALKHYQDIMSTSFLIWPNMTSFTLDLLWPLKLLLLPQSWIRQSQKKKTELFILRFQHTKFEVNISILYRGMAQIGFDQI